MSIRVNGAIRPGSGAGRPLAGAQAARSARPPVQSRLEPRHLVAPGRNKSE